jgi:hypothetical protein
MAVFALRCRPLIFLLMTHSHGSACPGIVVPVLLAARIHVTAVATVFRSPILRPSVLTESLLVDDEPSRA